MHSDDPETVKRYWSETRDTRDFFLKVEPKSVHQYVQKFEALREQLGRELVCFLMHTYIKIAVKLFNCIIYRNVIIY